MFRVRSDMHQLLGVGGQYLHRSRGGGLYRLKSSASTSHEFRLTVPVQTLARNTRYAVANLKWGAKEGVRWKLK